MKTTSKCANLHQYVKCQYISYTKLHIVKVLKQAANNFKNSPRGEKGSWAIKQICFLFIIPFIRKQLKTFIKIIPRTQKHKFE